MLGRILAAALSVLALAPAAPALAGDPIMPLGELRPGMQCVGYSVVRGTEPASFDVEIVDVVDGDGSATGPRILVEVSGPAIDATGVGPGFSGSPIYCAKGDAVMRNAGAISESIGEYGGRVALATPIESILGIPVDQPAPATSAGGGGTRKRVAGRPLAAPLTVAGLTTSLGRALTQAGLRRGRTILSAPAGPLMPFPPVTLKPGSAVSAGLSSGDLNIGAIGTVAYVDADKVWAFGHPLDNAGRRSLMLQDAYVYRVVNNPNQLGDLGGTYKLAAGGHTVGTVTSDGVAAIAGRTGPAAPTIPLTVLARDLDTKNVHQIKIALADETDVAAPTGGSAAGFIAPLAVIQALQVALKSSPAKSAGALCLTVRIKERAKPIRTCNRYVSSGAEGVIPGIGTTVAARAASDIAEVLGIIDTYNFAPPHITEITARVDFRRGIHQAFITKVDLPRTVRRGSTVTARVTFRYVRGGRETRSYRFRFPRSFPTGGRRITFAGREADIPEGDLLGELTLTIGGDDEDDAAGDPGPTSIARLVRAIRGVTRWDGVRVRIGRGRGLRAFRDDTLRLSGRATARTKVR